MNDLTAMVRHTAPAQASLRTARMEAAAAVRLLALADTLPAGPTQGWMRLPCSLIPEQAPPAPVLFSIDTCERGPDVTRLVGWAFADSPRFVRNDPPCLLFATGQSLWVLFGRVVERPDVAAAIPGPDESRHARHFSGFSFSCPSSEFPSPSAGELRVMFGQVAGTPALTPPLTLP